MSTNVLVKPVRTEVVGLMRRCRGGFKEISNISTNVLVKPARTEVSMSTNVLVKPARTEVSRGDGEMNIIVIVSHLPRPSPLNLLTILAGRSLLLVSNLVPVLRWLPSALVDDEPLQEPDV